MASAIGIALITRFLQRMAAKVMGIIKDKGLAFVPSMADKAMDKPTDNAIAMVVNKVDGIVNIETDISKLQTTLSMIQAVVQKAEMKQIDDGFIRIWLSDLVDIGYEARDVLDDFVTFSSCIITAEEASKPVNFISSLMLSYFGGLSNDTSKLPLAILNRLEKDIRSVTERFDKKKKEGETFKTLISVGGRGSESVRVEPRPEVGSFINKQRDGLFLGREVVKEGIMDKILHPSDDRVHVVAIWGMGGIGKTTLAQLIYNDERVKEDEYPTKNRKWLCVGKNKLSAKKVIREIVNDQNTVGIGNLQTKLEKELSGDRFLIVLDDVWDVDGSEWDLLFNPLTNVGKGLKGGLIIITTRKREVCTLTKTQTTYDLKPLSEQDSWLIFESFAYVNGKCESTPDLKDIGKEIVKRVSGLPLALKVVGCSLLDKDSSTWANFLEFKLAKDDEVMSALRWSYNHLPQHLKSCFTYCALFPKDHVFDEKVLVEMWMAHDLVQTEEQIRLEDVGDQYFKKLVNASLLQCVDGKYVMHDLIHDLATVVSNGEFASANSSLSNDQMEKVRHLSITLGDYSKVPRLFKIEKLLTLCTICSYEENTNWCDDSVLYDVFKQLKRIRVLVLSGKHIKEIPDRISELRHLRYLDVSRTSLKSLPDSLCHLYHLQMLAAPSFTVLPRNIVNMVNLRYIRANLPTCRGIEKLTSLQELSSIRVCKDDNIRELGDMQRLRGKLRIEGLANVEKLEDDVGALMEKQRLMDELELVFNQHYAESIISDEEVLNALGCPPNLKYLRIDGYNGLKPPSWMVDGKHKFDKLQTLELCYCDKLESLPSLGELTSLKHLYLWKVGVKRLGDEFYGKFTDGKVFFPSLESLEFSTMKEWEEWDDIINKNSSVSFFPRLTRLEINKCPKLVLVLPVIKNRTSKRKREDKQPIRNAANFMTSLSRFEISYCDGLKRLQLDALVSLKELDISHCKSLVQITSAICLATTIERLKIYKCELLEKMDFERLPSLNHLDVSCCNKLISIPCLVGIKFLELVDCESLRSLSINIHGLDSLKHLNINNCPVLELTFEEGSSSSSENLVAVPLHICTDNTQVFRKLLHHEFVSLESLEIGKLTGFKNFGETEANNFCKLRSLKRLCISECDDLKSLPRDFHKLSPLESLIIYDCPQLQSLPPPGLCELTSLKKLYIKSCPQLLSLPLDFHELSSFESLIIYNCLQLQSLPPSSLSKLTSPRKLDLKDWLQLMPLTPNFHKFSSLKSLYIEDCLQLRSLPPKLSSLKILEIHSCGQLQSLLPDVFHELSSLEDLKIISCPQLKSLPSDFHNLSSLERLNINSCPKLQSLPPSIGKLSSLERLSIKSCPKLQSLPPSLGKLSSLMILNIDSCEQLQSLPRNFHELSSLEDLSIKSCPQLQSLPSDFHKLLSLISLKIVDCQQLQSLLPPIVSLGKLSSIKKLHIESCPQLLSLSPNFHKFSSLKSLKIKDCSQLQSLPPSLEKLCFLKKLRIESCQQLQSLTSDFHKLSSLESLHIRDCPQLQPLLPPDIHELSSLKSIVINDCSQLQSSKPSINSLMKAYDQPLEERCKLESDHDWHQIKHIRYIYLSVKGNNVILISDGSVQHVSCDYEEEEEEEEQLCDYEEEEEEEEQFYDPDYDEDDQGDDHSEEQFYDPDYDEDDQGDDHSDYEEEKRKRTRQ